MEQGLDFLPAIPHLGTIEKKVVGVFGLHPASRTDARVPARAHSPAAGMAVSKEIVLE